MFATLLRKELREQVRTHRLLIQVAALTIIGLVSPILARYIPVLLSSIPDIPAGLAELIPDPTVKDAIDQYLKNLSQIGLFLVILLAMGSVALEKERGTAAMLFTMPVQRSAFILAKWLASEAVLALGLLLGAIGCYVYTAVLFEPLPLGGYAWLTGMVWLYLSLFLTVTLLASSLARTQAAAAGGAFGGLVILLILGALPRLSAAMPGRLLEWGWSVALGQPAPAWAALAVTIVLIVAGLVFAGWFLEREEI
jgi:ABC-2 type transport system permease protein